MKGFNSLVRNFLSGHERRKKQLAVVIVFAMLISFAVPLSLVSPADSYTGDRITAVPLSAISSDDIAGIRQMRATEGNNLTNMKDADGNNGNSPRSLSEVELLIGTGRDWTEGMTTAAEVIQAARERFLLGIASDFCIFLENDFSVSDSDAEGRVAIGGNLDATYVGYTENGVFNKSNYQVGAGDYVSSTALKDTDNYNGIKNFAHLILGGEMMKQVAPFSTTNKGAEISSENEDRYKRFVVSNKFDLYAGGEGEYINVHVDDNQNYIRYNEDHNHYGDTNPFNDEEAQIYQTSSETPLIDFASEFQWLRARSSKLSKTHGIPGVFDESTQTLTFEYPKDLEQNVSNVYFYIDEWNNDVRKIDFVNIPADGTYPDGTPKCANIVVNCYASGNREGGMEVGITDEERPAKHIENALCIDGTLSSNGIHKYVSTVINGVVVSNNDNQNGSDSNNPTWNNNNKVSENILYNFPNASNIFLDTNFNGTILAPNADVYSDPKGHGHLSGSLIAKSFEGGLEFGYRPYRGDSSIARVSPGYAIPVDKIFEKEEIGGAKELSKLADAHLSLYDEETGAVVDAVISQKDETNFLSVPSGVDDKTKYAVEDEIKKTYTLKEDKAPDGFEKTNAEYIITVTEIINSVDENGVPTKITTAVNITDEGKPIAELELKTEDVYSYTNGGVYSVVARKITIGDNDYYITLDGDGNIKSAGPAGNVSEDEKVVATKVHIIDVQTTLSHKSMVTATHADGSYKTYTETVYEYDPEKPEFFKLGQMAWTSGGDECPFNIKSIKIYYVDENNQKQIEEKHDVSLNKDNKWWWSHQFNDGQNIDNVYGIEIEFIGTGNNKFQFQYYEDGTGKTVANLDEVWVNMDEGEEYKEDSEETPETTVDTESVDESGNSDEVEVLEMYDEYSDKEESNQKYVKWSYPDSIPQFEIKEKEETKYEQEEIIVYEDAVVSSLVFYTEQYDKYNVNPNFAGNTNTTAVDVDSDGTDDVYFSPENLVFMPIPNEIPTFENKPNLEFRKVDNNGNLLKGAEIVLEEKDESGEFKIASLGEGNGFDWSSKPSYDSINPELLTKDTLYRFREVTSPDGYEQADPIYFVKRTNSYISWTANEELTKAGNYDEWNLLDLSENRIIQMKDIFISGAKVKLTKVELGTDKIIDGSYFVLKCGDDVVYPVGNENGFEIVNGEIDLFDILRGAETGTYDPKYVKNGYLLPGSYSLEEVKAPDNYDCPTEPFRFTIKKKNGTYEIEQSSGIIIPAGTPAYAVNAFEFKEVNDGNTAIKSMIVYYADGSFAELENAPVTIGSGGYIQVRMQDKENGIHLKFEKADDIVGIKMVVTSNSGGKITPRGGGDNGWGAVWGIVDKQIPSGEQTVILGYVPDSSGNTGGESGESPTEPATELVTEPATEPVTEPATQPQAQGKNINQIYFNGPSYPEYMIVQYYHSDGTITEQEISQSDWNNNQNYSVSKDDVVAVQFAIRSNGFWGIEFKDNGNKVFGFYNGEAEDHIYSSEDFPSDKTFDKSVFERFPKGKTVKYIRWCRGGSDGSVSANVTYYYENADPVNENINLKGNWGYYVSDEFNKENVVAVKVIINYPENVTDKLDIKVCSDNDWNNPKEVFTVDHESFDEGIHTAYFGDMTYVNETAAVFSLSSIVNLNMAALKRSSYPRPEVIESISKSEGETDSETTDTTDEPLTIEITAVEETGYYNIKIPNKPAGDTMDITVEKKWDDENYEYLEPESVQVQLYKGDEPYEAEGVKNTVTLNSENNWEYKWTELPRGNGETYSVKEIADNIAGKYEATYSPESLTSGGKITVTNTLKTISINAEKKWDGVPEGMNIDYPAVSVNVQRKDGTEWVDVPNTIVKLTADENWNHEFSGLPAGYTYRIVETGEYIGWTKTKDKSDELTKTGDTGTITNTLDSGSLEISKDWLGDNSEHDEITVNIYRDVDRYAEKSDITAIPADSVYEDYGRLLQYSLFLYDENMCGDDVTNSSALSWRDDCHTYTEVKGGYHDAGDHVMFGLPQGFTASTLGWTFYEYSASFNSLGLTSHYQAIMKRFCDFFVNATEIGGDGKVARVLYQRGTGETDHSQWITPELQTGFGDEYWADGNDKKASDIAAEYAAALAIYTLNFPNDENNQTYLEYAEKLFAISREWNGRTNIGTREGDAKDSGSFYWISDSDGGTYLDEQFWAAEWLYLATGDTEYKTACDNLRNQKINLSESNSGNSNFNYINNRGHFWDDVTLGAEIVYQSYISDENDWGYVDGFLSDVCRDSYTYNDNKCDTSYLYLDPWGNSRHNTLTQLAALTASKYTDTDYSEWAKTQMNHILGMNDSEKCFVVGFADNSATQPQHRAAASADGSSWNSYVDSNKRAVGALVAGDGWSENGMQGVTYGAAHHLKKKYIAYTDDAGDYVSNEVALDYNAGLVGAAAALFYNFNTGVPENNAITGISSKSLSDFSVEKYTEPDYNFTSTPAKQTKMTNMLYEPVEIDIADDNEDDTIVMNIGQKSNLDITGGEFVGFMDKISADGNIAENGTSEYASYENGYIKADKNGTTNIILKKSDNSYIAVPLIVKLQAAVPGIAEHTETLVKQIKLNSGNNWKYKLSNLPRFDSMGRQYRYYAVEVNSNGTTGNITNSGAVYVPVYDKNGIELSKNDNSITISNNKTEENTGISMPSTGGSGTKYYYVFGGALILLAAAAYCFTRRKRIDE